MTENQDFSLYIGSAKLEETDPKSLAAAIAAKGGFIKC